MLGDTVAARALEKVDYDFARLKLSPKLTALAVTTRAKHFDDWTSRFLAEHDRATVLNLGAGLDSRVWRVAPGPGVTWYDVDYPGVAAAPTWSAASPCRATRRDCPSPTRS
ncbi:class I SAM-dependent methyltransferase [Nonomuraea sp. B12E4]|uniref:class I SAM-dependent methyltransferase n=1 Tax=Nonomuraea sp. B12E4 TaxID=3153564 RepID=UPI00325F405D